MKNLQSNSRYINLGLDQVIYQKKLIGIFDLDSVTVKKDSRQFINQAQRNREIEDMTTDLPVTFILCDAEDKKQKVLLSSFSLPTLYTHITRKFP